MKTITNYDRWLKDAAPWAQEDDWDMDEYFKWVKRLSEAKSQLDDTYLAVDKELLATAAKMAGVHEEKLKQAGEHPWFHEETVAKLVVRYIIAYHFFTRATFEEIPDKALVGRVQQHFALLEIGMLDVDVAHMLQCAADQVPLETAVRARLAEFSDAFQAGAPTVDACFKWYLNEPAMLLLFKRLRVLAQSQQPPPYTAAYTKLWTECRAEYAEAWPEAWNQFGEPAKAWDLKAMTQTLDTKAKLDLFIARRAEPQLRGEPQDNDNMRAVGLLMAEGGDLDRLLAAATKAERERCSWDATIGPAVKALRRLGRTSSGKDYKKLAQYAQAHAKPMSL